MTEAQFTEIQDRLDAMTAWDPVLTPVERLVAIYSDMLQSVEARRWELQRPSGGQSVGPRGGPLANAGPGVLKDVEWWAARIKDEVLRMDPPTNKEQ